MISRYICEKNCSDDVEAICEIRLSEPSPRCHNCSANAIGDACHIPFVLINNIVLNNN